MWIDVRWWNFKRKFKTKTGFSTYKVSYRLPRPRVQNQDKSTHFKTETKTASFGLETGFETKNMVSRWRTCSEDQEHGFRTKDVVQDKGLGLKTKIMVLRPRPWSEEQDHGLENKKLVSRPWSWPQRPIFWSLVQDHGLETKNMVSRPRTWS